MQVFEHYLPINAMPCFPCSPALALVLLMVLPAASQAQPNPQAAAPAAAPVQTTAGSCEELAARQAGQYRDGSYGLQVLGQLRQLYCHDMAGQARTYLELPEGNCSEYVSFKQGGTALVQTCFQKVRLDTRTLRVDIGDLTFSTTQKLGSITHDGQVVKAMPYATAMACDAPQSSIGRARIALAGTGFAAVNTFRPQGYLPAGAAQQEDGARTFKLQGGGFCGWNAPGEVYNPFYAESWKPFANSPGFLLQLRLMDDDEKADANTARCYWMENYTHLYKWYPADRVYARAIGKSECLALDSCNGGGAQSGGGCYKWATVPPGEQWDGEVEGGVRVDFEQRSGMR